VLSLVAGSVHSIERIDTLTRLARERLDALAFVDIHLRTGDGTLGWPEAAPFDAILVAAAGPEVPPPLKQQLATGGRLLMPLEASDPGGTQWLLRVVRHGDDYEREILGGVSFVPLIGQYGWTEDGAAR
jgi:protein-L-isoaspartate(D-aspartate) O-methyltransferase